MMRVRYKATKTEAHSSIFNTHALNEVLTGDDSAFIHELDVWLHGSWKGMKQAFKDKDIIPNNYNTMFREPINEEEKERGYFL